MLDNETCTSCPQKTHYVRRTNDAAEQSLCETCWDAHVDTLMLSNESAKTLKQYHRSRLLGDAWDRASKRLAEVEKTGKGDIDEARADYVQHSNALSKHIAEDLKKYGSK